MALDDTKFPQWGDNGSSPPNGTQFDGGDLYNAQYADYLWNNLHALENDIISKFNSGLDAQTYKGNDIDTDGDAIVNEADYAYDGNATSYKHNDIDTNGDGIVNKADDVSTWYRNTDIPKTELKDGDRAIGREVYVPSGKTIRFYEAGVEPNGAVVPSGLQIEAIDATNDVYIVQESARHKEISPTVTATDGPIKVRMLVRNSTGSTQEASGGFVWTLD